MLSVFLGRKKIDQRCLKPLHTLQKKNGQIETLVTICRHCQFFSDYPSGMRWRHLLLRVLGQTGMSVIRARAQLRKVQSNVIIIYVRTYIYIYSLGEKLKIEIVAHNRYVDLIFLLKKIWITKKNGGTHPSSKYNTVISRGMFTSHKLFRNIWTAPFCNRLWYR